MPRGVRGLAGHASAKPKRLMVGWWRQPAPARGMGGSSETKGQTSERGPILGHIKQENPAARSFKEHDRPDAPRYYETRARPRCAWDKRMAPPRERRGPRHRVGLGSPRPCRRHTLRDADSRGSPGRAPAPQFLRKEGEENLVPERLRGFDSGTKVARFERAESASSSCGSGHRAETSDRSRAARGQTRGRSWASGEEHGSLAAICGQFVDGPPSQRGTPPWGQG